MAQESLDGSTGSLCRCLCAEWQGDTPPEWFNEAMLVFFPTAACRAQQTVYRAQTGQYSQ